MNETLDRCKMDFNELIPTMISSRFEKDKYFVTGSRRFGVETQESDLDIVLETGSASILKQALDAVDIKTTKSSYFDGWYYIYQELKINIIPLSGVQFEAWKMAAEINDKFKLFGKNKSERLVMHGILHTLAQQKIMRHEINNKILGGNL